MSRSGYYYWRGIDHEGRMNRDLKLIRDIEKIHLGSHKTYGSPRVLAILRGLGYKVGKKKVSKLMKDNNIRAKTKKKFKVTTDSKHNHKVAPNHLGQDFRTYKPNQVWLSDITYIHTGEGWLYLATVMDLHTRKIVGWNMSKSMAQHLTIDALELAIKSEKPGPGLIHHSDRGVQYACQAFRRKLKVNGFIASMSRKGNCWDNSPMESFFHTLKTEFVYFSDFKTRVEAKTSVFWWIYGFYNRKRIHSSLGYKTPVDFEREFMLKAA